MEGKLLEIFNSWVRLDNLVKEATNTITRIRDTGFIDHKVQGIFESGTTDDITRADKVIADFYFRKSREYFPGWHVFIEDHEHEPNPETFKQGDIGIFWDPLDGTKLFVEGKPGYSTMAGVALYDDKGFRPILGMFNIITSNEFVWAYHDGKETYGNLQNFGVKKVQRSPDKLIMGRTPVERKGLLTPLAQSLGYEVKMIRGVAPHAMALVRGETDFFVYEPGITLSDIMPVAPIIMAVGGDIFDLRGNAIRYSGNKTLDEGVIVAGKQGKMALKHGTLAKNEYAPKAKLLQAIAEVYKD